MCIFILGNKDKEKYANKAKTHDKKRYIIKW